MLGKQKYVQQDTSAWTQCLWGWPGYWKTKKDIKHLVLVKSQQNWLKKWIEQFSP